MNLDLIQAVVRALMNAVGGVVITKGWADSSLWEAVAGGAVALTAIAWSWFHQRSMIARVPPTK